MAPAKSTNICMFWACHAPHKRPRSPKTRHAYAEISTPSRLHRLIMSIQHFYRISYVLRKWICICTICIWSSDTFLSC